MKKVLSIVGARPQFVKCAPISHALRGEFKEVLVHTGQHYDYMMSESFFKELEIPEPDYNLEVGSGTAIFQMANIMLKLQDVVDKESPDIMIVFGDTNSTSAAAVVAAKNYLPLVHVEAGLREFNKLAPEEANKLLTDSISDLMFSPTETGVTNLRNEGKVEGVYNVGDVGIDLIMNNIEKISKSDLIFNEHGLIEKEYVFMTCHRAENTDSKNNLKEILTTVGKLKQTVVFPMHPRTKNAIKNFGLENLLNVPNLILLEPIGFWDTQHLLMRAQLTITDSGGIIKEAYFHKVPGIIIDKQTEWLETIEEGWNQLVGPHTDKILEAVSNAKRPKEHSNCLGDGKASTKIINIIKDYINEK